MFDITQISIIFETKAEEKLHTTITAAETEKSFRNFCGIICSFNILHIICKCHH
jgi:hypothetical protein